MSQDALIILLLRTGLIAGLVSLVTWVLVYDRLTRHAAWRDPIGRTLIAKTLLIAGLFVPSILGLFFKMNRLNSHIVAWTDVVLIGLVTPVMWWRTWVFERIHRRGKNPPDSAPLKEGFTVIETKVKASTAAAAVSGIVLWILGKYVFNGSVPDVIASWVYALVPAVVAGAAGYLAPHTNRPAAPAPPAAPPAGPVA